MPRPLISHESSIDRCCGGTPASVVCPRTGGHAASGTRTRLFSRLFVSPHWALAVLFVIALYASTSAAAFATDTSAGVAPDKKSAPLPSIAKKTASYARHKGLLTFHVDRRKGKLWLELPPEDSETGEIGRFLYVEGLLTGLGSNPVGLDRGQIGATRLIVLRRVGGRVLIEQPNLRFRALSDQPAERRAVRQSFATSVLWAGDIAARDPDGRTLVDFTSFIVRDAHGVVTSLKRSKQGKFKLDAGRSVVDLKACLAFPDNLELEALLTFSTTEPGRHVRTTAPTPTSVTLVQHHSLLRLPDDDYKPRRFDPRMPSYPIRFIDYAAPLSAPLDTRWISRHRLEKTDPTAARSKVKEPIVYYVDQGVPEPVRSALVEGASWWAEAFDAAGFVDAFRVELLPQYAHPLDARYNVIQWVHRSTRGWSYGGSVTDPRTGEIIKGHVSLGSLRVRQDRLLFEGLAGTTKTGSGDADDPIELALSRIRQLAAHEVGHTLGFAHNFAASTYGGRASVMDYPAPLITIDAAGSLDFSSAYAVGIGAWDIVGVKYAYSQFAAPFQEQLGLAEIVRQSQRDGMIFISDADARPAGVAHPLANLWDNGSDPVTALEHTIKVRRIAIKNFGQHNIQPQTPLSLLREVFVPVYLHHRYQLKAAAKVIGGLDYSYALRGDARGTVTPNNPASQRRAIAATMKCLTPEFLDIPDSVLSKLLPRPFGYGSNRELFSSHTGVRFDALGVAATAADMAIAGLLNPQRCARVVEFHNRDSVMPSLSMIFDALLDTTFPAKPPAKPTHWALRRAVQQVVVARFIDLSQNTNASHLVRAKSEQALRSIHDRLSKDPQPRDPAVRYIFAQIKRYLDRPAQGVTRPSNANDPPPGSPIGMPANLAHNLGRCSFDATGIDR